MEIGTNGVDYVVRCRRFIRLVPSTAYKQHDRKLWIFVYVFKYTFTLLLFTAPLYLHTNNSVNMERDDEVRTL